MQLSKRRKTGSLTAAEVGIFAPCGRAVNVGQERLDVRVVASADAVGDFRVLDEADGAVTLVWRPNGPSTVRRAGRNLLTIPRPIVRFEMPGKLRLGEQDGFRLHGFEQRRLVRIMRRILV